ncbi:MAG: M1 family metallopeptidase [Chloroflexi bacterium]|nr:M1 family metallopeptidase [Chloroflexota bacterium]
MTDRTPHTRSLDDALNRLYQEWDEQVTAPRLIYIGIREHLGEQERPSLLSLSSGLIGRATATWGLPISQTTVGQIAAAIAIAIVVALYLAFLGPNINDAEPEFVPIAEPTATTETVVGIRGSDGVGHPVFPSFGNGGYDVSHYDLDLNIDPVAPTLGGVAVLTMRATESLVSFNLDFAGPAISAVEVNDEPAVFIRQENELIIEPATVIPNGSVFTVRVTYGGTPEPLIIPDFDFPLGWTRLRDTIVVLGPGMAWYPANQTPSDRATFSMRFTVPNPLVVSASGILTATIDNGDTSTYVWELAEPSGGLFGPIVFTISDSVPESIAGPDGLAIDISFPPETSEFIREQFDVAGEIVELLIDLFGPFPYESFGITYLPEDHPLGNYGEPQRLVAFYADELDLAFGFAQQWFGGSITPASTADTWLTLGFTTYAQLLWVEHVDGARAYDARARAHRGRIGDNTRPPAVATSPVDILDFANRFRGALTLYTLRQELGDDDFFEVLRTFTDRFKHSAASTADFIAVAEEVSQQDLAEFFDAWLYTEAVPPPG